MPNMDAPLPAWSVVYGTLVFAHIVNEWGFYWTHRLFHHRAIYKYFHKQHHTYVASMGIAAEYAHPLEVVVSNQIPTVLGCILLGAHPVVFIVWIGCRLEQTYEAHSGYSFKGTWLHHIGLTNSSAAAYHDFHHSGNRGNFGIEYLDYFCGTMDAWIKEGGEDGYIAKKMKRTS